MSHPIRLAVLTLLLVLASCGVREEGGGAGENFVGSFGSINSGSSSGGPQSCELADMRDWVDTNMRDYYLFYDQVPLVDLQSYNDLNDLIKALRVFPDEFSYVTDAQQATALFDEGILFGFGHLIERTAGDILRFTQIYTGSPLDQAGVKRGDTLLLINGDSPFEATSQEIDDFYGVSGTPATMTFSVRDQSGLTRNLTLTSASFRINTVITTDIINTNSQAIGYIAFDSFLETSRSELDAAFVQFKQANVDELILDLRYNRGGRIDVARKLASLVVGDGGLDNVFVTFALNDKYQHKNESINFTNEANALNLNRLIVLTTDSSCSASELVINSLEPFIDVVVVGGSTCGKPYGSLGREACGKQMNALEYELVNASNVGGYFNGIVADCPATDDFDRALGDPQEGLLRAGLDYIANGSCQNPSARSRPSRPETSGPAPWGIQRPAPNLLDGLSGSSS